MLHIFLQCCNINAIRMRNSWGKMDLLWSVRFVTIRALLSGGITKTPPHPSTKGCTIFVIIAVSYATFSPTGNEFELFLLRLVLFGIYTRVVPKLVFSLSGWTCNAICQNSDEAHIVVQYLSNKHSRTCVCRINLELQLVLWKQLQVPRIWITRGVIRSGQKMGGVFNVQKSMGV